MGLSHVLNFYLTAFFPLYARLMKRLKGNLLNMTTIGRELSVQEPPDGRLHTNEQFPFMCFGVKSKWRTSTALSDVL